MELVLGVSMTPTTVRMVVVEGEKADGAIVEHDVFDITATDGAAISSASNQVIAAVLGTQEGALAAGHHLVSTGVSWSDHAEAAVLREALGVRGLEDVLLVSELHAAAALAQAVGRAVGYDKTALIFIERDTATLAVVETTDGSVVKVLSKSLHNADAIAVLTEMVASLEAQESVPQGMFVVGSSVDVTSVKAHLKNLLSMPIIAPEQPQLALARGAALASANAPRYDTSTIGLAYSQDPDGAMAVAGDAMLLGHDATTILGHDATVLLGYDATTLLGHEDAFADTADIASDSDDVRKGGKPFLLMGSSLTAVFAAGVVGLAITLAVNIEPTVDRGPGRIAVPPNAAAPTLGVQTAPPPAARAVPEPAPAPAPPAPAVTARLKAPPAPARPPVLVRNEAPAPAAPPPARAPAPPVVAPPVVAPAPVIQLPFLPPVVLPPPFYSPRVEGPRWYPAPKKPPWRQGGGRGGGHGRGHHD